MVEEYYKTLILNAWKPLQEVQSPSLMQQFADNLVRMKRISKEWGKNFLARQQTELKKVEEGIKEIYNENVAGFFSEAELKKLKDMEVRRIILLDKEEQLSRLKIKPIWITNGYNNNKFFNRLASH